MAETVKLCTFCCQPCSPGLIKQKFGSNFAGIVILNDFCKNVLSSSSSSSSLDSSLASSSTIGPTTINNFKKWSNFLDDPSITGCSDCLSAIDKATTARLNLRDTENRVRKLQLEILKEMKELKSGIGEFSYEMMSIEGIVRNSSPPPPLPTQNSGNFVHFRETLLKVANDLTGFKTRLSRKLVNNNDEPKSSSSCTKRIKIANHISEEAVEQDHLNQDDFVTHNNDHEESNDIILAEENDDDNDDTPEPILINNLDNNTTTGPRGIHSTSNNNKKNLSSLSFGYNTTTTSSHHHGVRNNGAPPPSNNNNLITNKRKRNYPHEKDKIKGKVPCSTCNKLYWPRHLREHELTHAPKAQRMKACHRCGKRMVQRTLKMHLKKQCVIEESENEEAEGSRDNGEEEEEEVTVD